MPTIGGTTSIATRKRTKSSFTTRQRMDAAKGNGKRLATQKKTPRREDRRGVFILGLAEAYFCSASAFR